VKGRNFIQKPKNGICKEKKIPEPLMQGAVGSGEKVT
jgi:hypothetical protein